jgi:sialate O-acetylesterase
MRSPRALIGNAAGVAVLCSLASFAHADVQLAAVFGDHMVLQRGTRVNLWGTAAPGELIRVRPSWYSNDAAVTAGQDGRFEVTLTTPNDAGPHTIRLRGRNEVLLDDVLLGEVWLCSGQSNMEMGVGYQHPGYSGVLNWEQELSDAERPRIRLFTVQNLAAAEPQADVRGIWRVANAEHVKGFSATAWFFAKRLEHELGVPVGVIASDWGGTPAESWTSARGLAEFPQFAGALAECARLAADPRGAATVQEESRRVWGREAARLDPWSAAHAEAAGFDDSAWSRLPVPGVWRGDLASFDGFVWLRREVEIPAAWAGRELSLELDTIDDDDRTWFQGTLVGATEGWTEARRYRVPAALVKAGRATIAVRVLDTGGEGGMRGEPAALRLRPTDLEAELPLAGEWRAARGAALGDLPPKPAAFEVGPNTPSALFNGMIAPLAGLRLAGFLWYQGESNVRRAEEYRALFPALIRDWRAWFRAELPFLYVQIAPFGYGGDLGEAGDLRAAQADALRLPRTGMALTLDIGDPADIHPKDKQSVGRRLADLALALAYGKPTPAPPPSATGAALVDASVAIDFDAEVESCGPSAFEVAGADGRFLPAPQLTVGGRRVVLGLPEGVRPVMVRYAWAAAARPSIRGPGAGLPIPQFRLPVP